MRSLVLMRLLAMVLLCGPLAVSQANPDLQHSRLDSRSRERYVPARRVRCSWASIAPERL
jgi:hypothetical protein